MHYGLMLLSVCQLLMATIDVTAANDMSGHNRLRLQMEKKKFMTKEDVKRRCQRPGLCSELPADCLKCNFDHNCVYGQEVVTECHAIKGVVCEGAPAFNVTHQCLYCYQLPEDQYSCLQNETCKLGTRFHSRCVVPDQVLCLGRRHFNKLIECNFATGIKWSTALLLSITAGGFGVDRFYLGNWQEGVGKLFSFGGLGVWTLLDVILIATGYLKPGDSRYL